MAGRLLNRLAMVDSTVAKSDSLESEIPRTLLIVDDRCMDRFEDLILTQFECLANRQYLLGPSVAPRSSNLAVSSGLPSVIFAHMILIRSRQI